MDDGPPSLGELLVAGFVAAFASVAPVAAFMAIADIRQPDLIGIAFLFGMPIALLHAYLVGLPFYLVLGEKWALTWLRALLGGFLVGAAPTGAAAMLTVGPHSDIFWLAVAPGALGTVGGAAFRAMLGPAR